MPRYSHVILQDGSQVLQREEKGKLTQVKLNEKYIQRVANIIEKYGADSETGQSKFQTVYLYLMASGATIKAA